MKKENKSETTNVPCTWPTCNKVNGIMISLQALKPENNQLVPMKDITIPMKFCRYHQLIAMAGICGAVQQPDNPTQWNLYAPVEIVTIAEAVAGAMIFSGQYDQMFATKKKAEDMLKQKQEVHQDENQGKNEQEKTSKSTDTDRNK